MKKACAAFLLAACLVASASGLTVMSYNVENLFDDVHNGTEYREFDPLRGTWNAEFFKVRIDSIAEVVRKAVPGGPDILLLQEIENEHALQTLAEEGLGGMGYTWRVLVPKKNCATNVAILSRFPVSSVRAHGVGPWKQRTPVRDVIEAKIEYGGNTLYVFNNHWKAKTEGVKATESSRLQSASVLARRVREILAQDPSADILVAGDMNESVDEYVRTGRKYQTALIPTSETTPRKFAGQSIFLSGNTRGLGATGDRLVLYDPWFELAPARRGSYSYQGEWLTVDHILLSAGLFDTRGFSYRWGSFGPVRLPFLFSTEGVPKKWTGLGAGRGYSDHLPLLVTLDAH
jgi:endonuclease/exonuclease/phosphatase family metal-dependent hydrolase